MNKYATDREAFGRQIRDFGQMQRYIAESWAKYRAMALTSMIQQIILDLEKQVKD